MSPIVSQAQRRFLHMKHPSIARKFEKETPKGAKLPKHKMAKRAIDKELSK